MPCDRELLTERTHRCVGACRLRGDDHFDAVAGSRHGVAFALADSIAGARARTDRLVGGLDHIFEQQTVCGG